MPSPAPDLAGVLERLDALTNWETRPRGGMRVGLEPMGDLMTRLGEPHRAFRSLHVAGTKGKGSVSALLEAALLKAGWRVGRYASPHVERINERVSLLGSDIGDEKLARAISQALDAYEAAASEHSPAETATWFDMLTTAAFLLFKEAKLDWAVVEVGLGGRLDSTNIVSSEIAIVTNIALEHTELLGHTRAAIAAEKGGIVKPGTTLVTPLKADDEAGLVLAEIAARRGATLSHPSVSEEDSIEARNVALASTVLDRLGELGHETRLAEGPQRPIGAWLIDKAVIAAARLPGRSERFWLKGKRGDGSERRVPVILDGAHVPFNLETVLRDLRREPELQGECIAVAAFGADKDAKGLVEMLSRETAVLIPTELPRGYTPEEVAALAEGLGLASEIEHDPHFAVARGLALAAERNGFLLVTGSLHLVGTLRPWVRERQSGDDRHPR